MNNIVLIGFMGAGKTSFGKWLAKSRGWQFKDTDAMIEEQEKIAISEIFAKNGEPYFRDLETNLIKLLIADNTDNVVLSVGGGLPVREENRALLQQFGEVVYLRATVDTLCKRLDGDKSRPLLQGGSVRERIVELMSKREAIYEECATKILDTDRKNFEEIGKILEEQ